MQIERRIRTLTSVITDNGHADPRVSVSDLSQEVPVEPFPPQGTHVADDELPFREIRRTRIVRIAMEDAGVDSVGHQCHWAAADLLQPLPEKLSGSHQHIAGGNEASFRLRRVPVAAQGGRPIIATIVYNLPTCAVDLVGQ